MCGISAGIRLKSGPSLVPLVRRMTSTLAHRGPDASGFAAFDNERVVLGHVRLSIVDIGARPQPLTSVDGQVTISFNGEIYQHAEWRERLRNLGHAFATETDTEVIVALYQHYGLDFLQHLNGEFAFILYDAGKKRLIAVRDRFGIKPLFFHRSPSLVTFCSENKGILALPHVERRLGDHYLTGALMTAYPAAISPYAGIEAVRPGHYIVIENDHVAPQQCYWRPSYPTETRMSLKSATEGLRHHLTEAVRRRLVADVPVCAYLSGGIDSALVCGLAAQSGQTIKAFNIGFSQSVYDETAQARRIAEHFGVEFESIACPPEVLAQNLSDTLFHTETALHNASSIGKFLLSKKVYSQGYKVALTGEGADEILAGYPFFKLEALWRMLQEGGKTAERAQKLLAQFEKTERRSEGVLWNKGDAWRTAPHPFKYPFAMFLRAHVYGPLMRHMLHDDIIKRGSQPAQVYVRDYNKAEIDAMHPLHGSMVITLNQLSNYIFPNMGDRLEMAHHVEGRTPFLDRDLVAFVATVPPEYLLDMGRLREKFVLHEAFDAILPTETQKEHKHPFLAPNWRGLSRTKAGRPLFEHHLSPEALTQSGICNVKGVARLKKLWQLLPAQSVTHRKLDAAMGTVISLQILHDRLVAQRPPCDPEFPMHDMTPEAHAQS